MALFPRHVPLAATLAAVAAASIPAGVLGCVFVALRAMSFPRLLGRKAFAPEDILLLSHGFQMGRPHTRRNPAEMVQNQPLRHWANQMFVSPDVCGHARIGNAQGERPVAQALVGGPEPAPIRLIDLCPESLGLSHREFGALVDGDIAITALPRVMPHTEAVAASGISAIRDGALLSHTVHSNRYCGRR